MQGKEKINEQKRYYLNLADLFFNMVITLKEANINVDSLTYEEVENYGSMIQEIGKNNKLDIILVLSKDDTHRFYYDNCDYVEEQNGSIKLRKNFTRLELINEFRGYIPLDLLLTIVDLDLKKTTIKYYKGVHNINSDLDYSCTSRTRK